jgi:hypothetical protein
VYRKHSRGYGPYVFALTGPVGRLDPNVVLGLFTWDNWPVPPYLNNLHRELDIEFSRWGLAGDTNTQYVVQPWSGPGNRFRWWLPSDVDSSTHSFNWSDDSIRFLSVDGHRYAPPYDSVFHTLLYSGPDVPNIGTETPHMNLWLLNGTPPSNDSEVEVTVARFETSFVNVGLTPREPAHPLLERGCCSPARSPASIEFILPSPCHVVMKAFDALARERMVLIDGNLPAGRHEVRWRANGLPCGVYMLRIQADRVTECAKLTLLE